jgi:hypothetical protein
VAAESNKYDVFLEQKGLYCAVGRSSGVYSNYLVVKVNYVNNNTKYNVIYLSFVVKAFFHFFLINDQNGDSKMSCIITSHLYVRSLLIFSPFEQFNCRKENNNRDYSNYSEVYHCSIVVSVDHDIV